MSIAPSVKSGQPPFVQLDAAQIARDLLLQLHVRRLAEVVDQQHVFGGDGCVRFEFVRPSGRPVSARREWHRSRA